MMRIISGSARGTKLNTLEGENTRPTLERVKEAIFSMIQFEISDAKVLDLFAGSGQLALEALSRGAASADAVDSSSEASRIIRSNIEKTHMSEKCSIYRMSADEFIRQNAGKKKYTLVFLDPPYAKGLIPNALTELSDKKMLSDKATVICELAAEDDVEMLLSTPKIADLYSVRRNATYAKTRVLILDYSIKEKESADE